MEEKYEGGEEVRGKARGREERKDVGRYGWHKKV